MITIWCSHKSNGARLLVNKIKEMGHEAQLLIGGTRPRDAVWWGRGGGNKYHELQRLHNAGIPVPPHSLLPHAGWLSRSFTHMGARDLLRGTGRDFYVQRLDIDMEFRFHIFNGLSIRRQFKEPRLPEYHPWIRSWKSGWKLTPGGPATRDMRIAAVASVEAVGGYLFGAVDIGRLVGGGFVVLEVNTRPGIEGSTVIQYAKAVIEYAKNH